MSNQRTHYVTGTDGVTIGGTVDGKGPQLVFLHGMLGDGDLDWDQLTRPLIDRFTCHRPSQRGRGLSEDHPDLSYARQVEDLQSYIASLDPPIGLVGWSGGVWPVLHATARTDGVTAAAAIEPESVALADLGQQAAFGAAVEAAGQLAAQGDLPAAVRPLAGFVFDEDEISILDEAGYLEAAGRYIPNLLGFIQQLMGYEGATGDDPAVLSGVSVPVLVLKGSKTKPLAAASAQHVTTHVPDARLREIGGAGHAAPLTHPEALAEMVAGFFEQAHEAA